MKTEQDEVALPELPKTHYKVDPAPDASALWNGASRAVPAFTAEQMYAYAREAVLAERERCADEIEAIRTNDRAVNLSAGEIMRNEIADDLLAAIRKGTP